MKKIDTDLKIIYIVLISGVVIIILLPFILTSSTLYERYITGEDTQRTAYATLFVAQTFTVGNTGMNENFDITSLEMYVSRYGTPGNVTIRIKGVDGSGHPTGNDLSISTINANDWSTFPGAWETINMTSYELQASTQYAIILSAPDNEYSDRIGWRADASAPTYGGGNYEISVNGGTNWTAEPDDFLFEVWGEAVAVDTCTCAGAGNNWEIDMSDYCNITDACDLTTGTLSFTGAGWCNCNASVDTTNLGDPGAEGILYIQDSCLITID